jgi:tetratricopeptide (TPR) repeat protein
MRGKWNIRLMAGLAASLFLTGVATCAQYSQGSQGNQQQPPPQQTDKDKKAQDLSLDVPPPVNAQEDADFKAFQDTPSSDPKKRITLGEAFVQKYPQSRYRPPIYSALTVAYMQDNQVQKMLDTGEKAVELTPTDVTTLAILGQSISRLTNANSPDPGKQLEKAENYSKRAIEIAPTLPKPAGLTDEAFATAKNQTLATAHSGLGLVYVKRAKYAEAIPELEQSIKLDPTPDPVNYYLLGLANQKASHFDDAVAAYNKCASTPGAMQGACKTNAEEAKKLAATQLSAPK